MQLHGPAFPTEFGPRSVQSTGAHLVAQIRIAEKELYRRSPPLNVLRLHQKPCLRVQDRIQDSPGSAADHCFSRRIGFQEDHAKAFNVAVRFLSIRHHKQIAKMIEARQLLYRNVAYEGHRVGESQLRRHATETRFFRPLADDQIAQVGALRTDPGDGLERDVVTFPRVEPGDSKQHLLVLQGEAPDKILPRAARGKPLAIHTRGNLADAGFRDSDPKQLFLGESANCNHGIGLGLDAIAKQMLVSPLIHVDALSGIAAPELWDSETMLQLEP